MNVNETLKTMFSDLLPVAADTYKGKATEYIVFNYTAIPEDFGDDDAQHWRYLTQVHLYAPHEKNSLAYRRDHAAACRRGLYAPDDHARLRRNRAALRF